MARLAAKKGARSSVQYMLRLPVEMREAIARLASTNGRSTNNEIVAAIEDHLKRPTRLEILEAKVAKITDMLDFFSDEIRRLEEGMDQSDPNPD